MSDWKKIDFVTSASELRGCPKQPWPEVAFSGRSNVGKSSLINTIASRRALAKVSGKPGKTRLLNFFLLGGNHHLVDLPGYGYAAVSKSLKEEWAGFVSNYLQNREQLAGVVQLIDSRHPPTKLDIQMVEWLREAEIPVLLVLTKVDKIKRGQRAKTLSSVRKTLGMESAEQSMFFSSETGEGKQELRLQVDSILSGWRSLSSP